MTRLSPASEFAFLAGFAFLLTHEIDAAFQLEWRVLPLIRALPEEAGRISFVWLHVPLIAGMAYACWHTRPGLRNVARLALASFCVVHAGLHWAFSGHQEYRFDGWESELLIAGAGLAGLVYLTLSATAKVRVNSETPTP
ncbi:MAG: DUF6713 family protein [Pseudomonadota bacterium]